ncbi:unnamed protein product, partial [Prorocentrum cordatum]
GDGWGDEENPGHAGVPAPQAGAEGAEGARCVRVHVARRPLAEALRAVRPGRRRRAERPGDGALRAADRLRRAERGLGERVQGAVCRQLQDRASRRAWTRPSCCSSWTTTLKEEAATARTTSCGRWWPRWTEAEARARAPAASSVPASAPPPRIDLISAVFQACDRDRDRRLNLQDHRAARLRDADGLRGRRRRVGGGVPSAMSRRRRGELRQVCGAG